MKLYQKPMFKFIMSLCGFVGFVFVADAHRIAYQPKLPTQPTVYLYVIDSLGNVLDSVRYYNESFYPGKIRKNTYLAIREDNQYIPVYRWQLYPSEARIPGVGNSDDSRTICSVQIITKFHLPQSTIGQARTNYYNKKALEAKIAREQVEKRLVDSLLSLSKNEKKDPWELFSKQIVDGGLTYSSAMQPYFPILKGYYENRIKEGLAITDANRRYISPFYYSSELAVDEVKHREIISRAKMSRGGGIRGAELGIPMSEDKEVFGIEPVTTSYKMSSPSPEPMAMSRRLDHVATDRIPESSKSISAGQITAGVWNDVDHWNEFEKTHQEANISSIAKHWGMQFNRQLVKLSDKNGKPLVDAFVTLKDGGEQVLWQCKTDNRGMAVLYLNFRGPLEPNGSTFRGVPVTESPSPTKDIAPKPKTPATLGKLVVTYQEKVYEKKNWKLSPNYAAEELQINQFENSVDRIVDVCLVVDATGSMGDELQYLKSEMMDVMLRSQGASPCSKFRFASVFYRDLGDEYVTKKMPFTDRVDDVVEFVNQQSVGGGGDFPEAVDSALATAVNGLDWSARAISRILFLVLDAPPHDYAALKLRQTIEKAAQLGIKIIPIAASGINKNCEFLFKYMSAATYGDYVYITDHSGIGNTHLKPTGVKENKQFLNDLMVELISKYSAYEGCNPENTNQMEPRVELFGDQDIQIQAYPNPAISDLAIQSNEILDYAEIMALDGRLVKKFDKIGQKSTYVSVDGLVAGIYVLRCSVGNGAKVYSTKILVMPNGGNSNQQMHN